MRLNVQDVGVEHADVVERAVAVRVAVGRHRGGAVGREAALAEHRLARLARVLDVGLGEHLVAGLDGRGVAAAAAGADQRADLRLGDRQILVELAARLLRDREPRYGDQRGDGGAAERQPPAAGGVRGAWACRGGGALADDDTAPAGR